MNPVATLSINHLPLAALAPVRGVAIVAALLVVVVLLISPFTGAGST